MKQLMAADKFITTPLVMMAMLFMLEVKLEQHRDVSLLSTADIVALLAH